MNSSALRDRQQERTVRRTLRLNVSAFYNDYENLQVGSEDPLPYRGGMTNVPKSHIYGIEAEMALRLPRGFRIDANLSAMKGKVDSNTFLLDPYVAPVGQPAIRPLHTCKPDRARGSVPEPEKAIVSDGSHLSARPAASAKPARSDRQAGWTPFFSSAIAHPIGFRIYNNPVTDKVPSQFLMTFNARFESAASPWYAELQITNLTDSDDVASRYAENFGVGAVFDSLVPPRQFIGRVGFRF